MPVSEQPHSTHAKPLPFWEPGSRMPPTGAISCEFLNMVMRGDPAFFSVFVTKA
jgi:hypothetical protein